MEPCVQFSRFLNYKKRKCLMFIKYNSKKPKYFIKPIKYYHDYNVSTVDLRHKKYTQNLKLIKLKYIYKNKSESNSVSLKISSDLISVNFLNKYIHQICLNIFNKQMFDTNLNNIYYFVMLYSTRFYDRNILFQTSLR